MQTLIRFSILEPLGQKFEIADIEKYAVSHELSRKKPRNIGCVYLKKYISESGDIENTVDIINKIRRQKLL